MERRSVFVEGGWKDPAILSLLLLFLRGFFFFRLRFRRLVCGKWVLLKDSSCEAFWEERESVWWW